MSVVWVDIIEEIVQEVQSDASKPSGLGAEAPYYLHGHIRDITKQLTDREENETLKFKKFPIICLLQDFTESNKQDMLIESEVNLNIVICTRTESEYVSPERYDNSYRNMLNPLYDLFIEKIAAYTSFTGLSDDLVPHDKIDRLYWGSEATNQNVFTDYVDAIEIQNLNLKYKQKNC
jgi:hypothetical protein